MRTIVSVILCLSIFCPSDCSWICLCWNTNSLELSYFLQMTFWLLISNIGNYFHSQQEKLLSLCIIDALTKIFLFLEDAEIQVLNIQKFNWFRYNAYRTFYTSYLWCRVITKKWHYLISETYNKKKSYYSHMWAIKTLDNQKDFYLWIDSYIEIWK